MVLLIKGVEIRGLGVVIINHEGFAHGLMGALADRTMTNVYLFLSSWYWIEGFGRCYKFAIERAVVELDIWEWLAYILSSADMVCWATNSEVVQRIKQLY